MSDSFDLLLAGGTVVNPATHLNQKLDVGVFGDRVTAIAIDLPRAGAKRVLDATGCYVTPGLIDFHVHSYWGVNPYGCDLDALCLATGVTTTMDAGSAGPVICSVSENSFMRNRRHACSDSSPWRNMEF